MKSVKSTAGKFLWIAFATTLLSAAAAFADQTAPSHHPHPMSLICESSGGYTECEAGVTVADVELVERLSVNECTFGGSWGYHGTRIWVNHGCGAEFSYEDANAPAPVPTPAPVPVPTPVPRPSKPIKSVDCRWNNMNWQPFYHVDMRFIGRSGHGFQDPNACVYTVQQSRRNAVCNWNGIGFTSYDIVTNAEVIALSYQSIDACYAALRR